MKLHFVWRRQKSRRKDARPGGSRVYLLGLAAILIGLSGCISSASSVQRGNKSPGKTVFFNSFERPNDVVSWYWAGSYQLSHDTPPGGGKQSLLLRGIRILPAASFISRPLRHGGYFTIECWGKLLDIGGYIQLATISNHQIDQTIQVHILEPEWKFLQSSDTLYCPPNTSLMLSMQAGGPLEGSIMVDMLRIRKVR